MHQKRNILNDYKLYENMKFGMIENELYSLIVNIKQNCM